MWKPALPSSRCGHLNDADANFCQACGAAQTRRVSLTPRLHYAFADIDQRLNHFRATFGAKPYERQKTRLELRMSSFLAALSPPRTIASCTGEDVVKFLIMQSC